MALITDSFTGVADTALPTYDARWVASTGVGANSFEIATGGTRCRNTSTGGTSGVYRTDDPGADDYPAAMDFYVETDDAVSRLCIGVRCGTNADPTAGQGGYYVGQNLGTDTVSFFRRNDAGGETVIATAIAFASVAGATNNFQIDAAGVGATVTVRGQVIRGSDGQYLKPDGTFQAGQIYCFEVADTNASRHVRRGKVGLLGLRDKVHGDNLNAGVAVALVAGVGSVTAQTDTTMTVSFTAATGGSGSYTYEIYRLTDPTPAASSGTLVSTTLSFTDTGLTADTFYCYKIIADDGPDTIETADAAVTALGFTMPADTDFVPALHTIGDSISTGGAPTWTARMATTLASLLDLASIVSGINGVGGGGMDSFVESDGTPTANFDGAVTAAIANDVTDFFIRLGTNDTHDKATWKSRYTSLIANLRTDAWPELVRVWLCPNIGRLVGGGNAANPTYHTRYREYQDAIAEIISADSGDDFTLHAGSRAMYEWVLQHPERLTDGTHLDQTGLSQLGDFEAYHWHAVMIQELGEGEGGGAVNPLSGLLVSR